MESAPAEWLDICGTGGREFFSLDGNRSYLCIENPDFQYLLR